MARMARRKPKVVWLPNNDAFSVGALSTPNGAPSFNQAFHTFAGAGGIPGLNINSDHAILFDQPAASTQHLADVESSGYHLRRIVGKIFVDVGQVASRDGSPYLCTAAFIIREVDQNGAPLIAPSQTSTVNPGVQLGIRAPWIWRRSWMLANGSNTQTSFAFIGNASSEFGNHEGGFPLNDGPHVDQKTSRIVQQNQSLFLSLSTTQVNGNADAGPFNIRYIWETRVLASMRANSGNRRNAAR